MSGLLPKLLAATLPLLGGGAATGVLLDSRTTQHPPVAAVVKGEKQGQRADEYDRELVAVAEATKESRRQQQRLVEATAALESARAAELKARTLLEATKLAVTAEATAVREATATQRLALLAVALRPYRLPTTVTLVLDGEEPQRLEVQQQLGERRFDYGKATIVPTVSGALLVEGFVADEALWLAPNAAGGWSGKCYLGGRRIAVSMEATTP